ncbi:MAG: hypothetical protein EYC68_19200 [Chloroflexota bacterium]|nr:MAG: hypothetical protein EYC68_19200 [Chloroflexota bacterium]
MTYAKFGFRGAIIIALLALSGTAVAATSFATIGVTNTLSQSDNVIADCGAAPPRSVGIVYESTGKMQPLISNAQAVAAATDWVGVPVNANTKIATQFVLYTNNNYTHGDPEDDPNAYLLHQNIPAYIVSFCNVAYASHGPIPAELPGSAKQFTHNFFHEVNVIVNATTGKVVARFGYR